MKKIILTTNQDLIKDGVQAIDDEFLEWFVKNPSCEEVKVNYGLFTPLGRQVDPMGILRNHSKCVWKYNIIIPKDEPKQCRHQYSKAMDEPRPRLCSICGNPEKEEPKQDKDMATLETQYKNFRKDNPNAKIHFEAWKKINARLVEQALVNMMKDDEELGLYDEPFKHKVEIIPAEEILTNRSNAYKFINFDKQEKEELNPHIGPFLLRNGFEKFKYENNIYTNPKCTINVLEGCYEILFENEYGEVSTYTDSWSIPHLVGVLTWNDLIDKNYNK